MTAAILKGKDPADMAIEYPTKGTTYLNQKQAQQLGIDLPNELVTQISKKELLSNESNRISNWARIALGHPWSRTLLDL